VSASAAAKRALRARIRAALAALPAEERRERGARAANRALELPAISRARHWLLFRSLADEIDTETLFEAGRAGGRRLYAPRVVGVELRFVAVELATTWTRGTYPVLEPAGPVLDPYDLAREPTLILVPGLAFGARGERLGRGGGHYDRALAGLRAVLPDLLALSLALDLQVVDGLPVEPHDRPVDVVVTESRVLRR
jgi:5-formyltetrahydrofolate cyclo-ligase